MHETDALQPCNVLTLSHRKSASSALWYHSPAGSAGIQILAAVFNQCQSYSVCSHHLKSTCIIINKNLKIIVQQWTVKVPFRLSRHQNVWSHHSILSMLWCSHYMVCNSHFQDTMSHNRFRHHSDILSSSIRHFLVPGKSFAILVQDTFEHIYVKHFQPSENLQGSWD